jgi:membrane-bound lytic murein transglycosylase A
MDPAIYPPGIPAIVRLDLPKTEPYPAWVRDAGMGAGKVAIMLFNHDKGSAIKGPFRLDLYCGTGYRAGALAGRLKAKAELYLLLDKEMDISF